jgi:hypothetical protein
MEWKGKRCMGGSEINKEKETEKEEGRTKRRVGRKWTR